MKELSKGTGLFSFNLKTTKILHYYLLPITYSFIGDSPSFAITKESQGQSKGYFLKKKILGGASGAPGGDRTHNLQLRRLTLCPIELQAQIGSGDRI